MAPIAGTASSVQGVVGTIGAAVIGFLIGQQFDGTAVPFVVGTAACAAGGFLDHRPDRAEAAVRADRRRSRRAGSGTESTAIPEDLALEDAIRISAGGRTPAAPPAAEGAL